jgi:hypothetical protein
VIRRLPRPTPSLVIACVALFVSLGGVSYGFATGAIDTREIKNETVRGTDIRNGTLTTKDLRNNEVRGADLRNSTVGGRDVAFNTLGGNDIKESTLTKVPDADNVDGVDSSLFLRKEAPAFTPLTLTGGATTVTNETAPGFDVDQAGYVHLRGTFTPGAGAAFTLPAGLRPVGPSRFAVADGGPGTAVLTIAPTGGATVAAATGDVSLDGVTFAPAP